MEWAEHLARQYSGTYPPPAGQFNPAFHQRPPQQAYPAAALPLGEEPDEAEEEANKKKASRKRKLPSTVELTEHGNPKRIYKGGPSTFGNKDNPLQTPFGLIDGRSNAEACFRQKVALLKEFKEQHGHLNVPQYPDDKMSKYRRLHAFLANQRKHYRKFQQGIKVPLTQERIQLLDEALGQWFAPHMEERFPELLEQLAKFHASHGHCCVGADKEFAKAQMLVFGDGSHAIEAGPAGARIMLFGGAVMDGPRHIWWNFVASDKEMIEEAKREWKKDGHGRFHLPPNDDQEFIPIDD